MINVVPLVPNLLGMEFVQCYAILTFSDGVAEPCNSGIDTYLKAKYENYSIL